MKNELLVTMALEYGESGITEFCHVVSIDLHTKKLCFDLIHTGLRPPGIIHSHILDCDKAHQLTADIKPLPGAQLRPPTPKEVSKYRARTI